MDDDPIFKVQRFRIIWIGYFFCVVLILLMGAFFFYHVRLLIQQPQIMKENLPVNLLFQLILIFGYALALKNEKIGSIVITISASLFLFTLQMPNLFIFFFVVLLSPIYFFIYHWFRESRMFSDE